MADNDQRARFGGSSSLVGANQNAVNLRANFGNIRKGVTVQSETSSKCEHMHRWILLQKFADFKHKMELFSKQIALQLYFRFIKSDCDSVSKDRRFKI